MIVKLQTQQLSSLEQVRLLMAGTAAVPFAIAAHQDRYHWLARSLGQFGYLRLRRPERGLIIRFLCKVTGYSRAQLTRRHSDNGSAYVNHRVAKLLSKLHIEFTRSRSRHSNENALAESKNASVG
jgi:hypothetical protein